jgi:hypothetical protein
VYVHLAPALPWLLGDPEEHLVVEAPGPRRPHLHNIGQTRRRHPAWGYRRQLPNEI